MHAPIPASPEQASHLGRVSIAPSVTVMTVKGRTEFDPQNFLEALSFAICTATKGMSSPCINTAVSICASFDLTYSSATHSNHNFLLFLACYCNEARRYRFEISSSAHTMDFNTAAPPETMKYRSQPAHDSPTSATTVADENEKPVFFFDIDNCVRKVSRLYESR
jgi:hypothetical protein